MTDPHKMLLLMVCMNVISLIVSLLLFESINQRLMKIEKDHQNQMNDIDTLLKTVPNDVQNAIESICDKAGTHDADWNILKAAGEIIADKTHTTPQIQPQNLTEGEKYLITYKEHTTGQTIERVLFWIDGEWRATNNKHRQIMDCIYFADEPISIYGPIKLTYKDKP